MDVATNVGHYVLPHSRTVQLPRVAANFPKAPFVFALDSAIGMPFLG